MNHENLVFVSVDMIVYNMARGKSSQLEGSVPVFMLLFYDNFNIKYLEV